ncbi:hypothetical protein FA13DRAFT_975845 [Coprinellus micaceus]|uniref:F-box domain-containing protein n=1 Tax=Coprinellus micaceus TaxID=71717 RepID=A0A4Y7SZ16_COPMI|nr:hypothetical protein FA13DRAFT_975845 [Coprinellus micaceus]
MPTPHVPTEIVDEILKNVYAKNKKPTLLSSRMVCHSWSQTSPKSLFDEGVVFKSWDDVRTFLGLLSAPTSTFSPEVNTKHLALTNLTALDNKATAALESLMSIITMKESLSIHVSKSGIADILAQVSQGWAHIGRLTLSGGNHPPATFFNQLVSFPQLHHLTLQDFQLQGVQNAPTVQFRFPDVITKLSLRGSSKLWTFFRAHVIPGRGFAKISELTIETRFTFRDEGMNDMVQCFRGLEGIHTLNIHALPNPGNRDLIRDMKNTFQTRHLRSAAIPGLRRLYLGFSEMPAHFVFGCIIMHTIYLPSTQIGAIIEFEVPRISALGLWDDQDPQAQIRQLLLETQTDTPMAADFGRALRIRGCEGALPPSVVEASGRAMVCDYPVIFMGLGGEEGISM